MKQYEFTVKLKSSMDVKDIVWAFANKLKDVFHVVSIDYTVVKDITDYDKIPERY